MAPPVAFGDEVELKIDALAYGGNGVGRLNGFVLFVRRGLPGDVVRARVTKVRRSHAEATAVEVVEPGANRVEAPCDHYPACGGCRFQDLAYDVAALGRRPARCEMRSCGSAASPTLRWSRRPGRVAVPLPQQARVLVRSGAGRARARLPPRRALGRGARHPRVLADHRARQRRSRRGPRVGARARARAYDQAAQQGFLRHLVVREGRNTGQALIVLVTAPGSCRRSRSSA